MRTAFKRQIHLFKSTPQEKKILFITDSEGQFNSFRKSIEKSSTVTFHHDKGLCFKNDQKYTPHFIFGGDAIDRGIDGLLLTELLIDFKKRHPEQVTLLAGNRDIKNNRFRIELNPEVIRDRLLYSKAPRWLTNQTVPLDYVKSEMQAKQFQGTETEYVRSISVEQCQLIYLCWMLEKTMGSPEAFRYRRLELLKRQHHVSAEQVLQSFINESQPNGLSGQYLELAQVGEIIREANLLAIHGGLTCSNIGRLPNMKAEDVRQMNASLWIASFNKWYRQQIKEWAQLNPSTLTIPAFTDLDECVLPIAGKSKSVITADHLSPTRQFIPPSQSVMKYLRKNHIQIVLTGHQPCGDHPVILRDGEFVFINGDTGYSSPNSHPNDDTRGYAHHCLEITTSDIGNHIDIRAVLSDNTEVQSKFILDHKHVEGDAYIGLVKDNTLVQCKLPNGDYRLAKQKGFNVEYSVVSEQYLKEEFVDSECSIATKV